MSSNDGSDSSLQQQISDLTLRLREADELTQAIRNGEVDAFVVSSPEGDRVFSLTTADKPYRILIEQMQHGAIILTNDGIVTLC